MSEEEKLDRISNHLWWLSTFLVKLPLFIGCLWLIVLASKECNTGPPPFEHEVFQQQTALYTPRSAVVDSTGRSVSDRFLADELTKADLEKVWSLYLAFRQLTNVKGLEKLTQLTVLYLDGNQLTDVPKGLEKLDQLKELGLENNQLTDVKGLEKLTQLKGLRLGSNQLTEMPKGLENLTQLTWLSLHDNPDLTKAQIDELQKALPKCKIESNPTK